MVVPITLMDIKSDSGKKLSLEMCEKIGLNVYLGLAKYPAGSEHKFTASISSYPEEVILLSLVFLSCESTYLLFA